VDVGVDAHERRGAVMATRRITRTVQRGPIRIKITTTTTTTTRRG